MEEKKAEQKATASLAPHTKEQFRIALARVSRECYDNSDKHGFWKEDTSPEYCGNKIMLMVTELAEAVEGLRKPDDLSVFCKQHNFSAVEEELADCMIRIMDYAARFELNLGGAILTKMEYNAGRPHRHGKTM